MWAIQSLFILGTVAGGLVRDILSQDHDGQGTSYDVADVGYGVKLANPDRLWTGGVTSNM